MLFWVLAAINFISVELHHYSLGACNFKKIYFSFLYFFKTNSIQVIARQTLFFILFNFFSTKKRTLHTKATTTKKVNWGGKLGMK